MAEAQDEANLSLDKLIHFRRGVCLIEAGDYQGTGIHFGNGWIMSVAHNFQADDDPDNLHSLLSNAEFIFEDICEDPENLERRLVTFAPNANRMAFIHHLTPGDEIDEHHKDIAMVKLGVQYEYGGRTGEEWERQEKSLLARLNLPHFASLKNSTPQENERVYSIHYGDGRPIKLTRHTVTSVPRETSGAIPIIKFKPTLPGGASGCPILNKEYKLGGLLFGGGKYGNPNAEGIALQWGKSIYPYVNEGVKIIVDAESYMVRPNDDTRRDLETRAAENRLTIYLVNGQRIG